MSRNCCHARSWPARKAPPRRPRQAGRHHASLSSRRAAPAPLHRDAAQDQYAGVEPQQPLVSAPFANPAGPCASIGADDEREQGADNGKKHPQPDPRRQPRWPLAGEIADLPSSSQGFAVRRWCESHHPAIAAMPAMNSTMALMDDSLSGQTRRRLVLRHEIPFRTGHAVRVSPAIDDRQLLAPVAMRRRSLAASATPARWRSTDCRRPPCP